MLELTTPIPDRRAAETLRTIFDRVRFTEDSIDELLGDDAYTTGPVEALVHDRRLPHTRLGAVVRVCFLGLPVDANEAPNHFGDSLAALGLAETDGRTIRPRTRVAPIQGLYLASDPYSQGEDPRGYVATYTPTARTCDVLTPRPRVASALDVGTGPGIHALLAARHADRVVATDVNERALAFTELNAALNGFDHVEVRNGSLFEPVEGETFDLITCNAPYVVSPDRRWAYRDSGFQADALSESLVREGAAHLVDGGFAALQVSWLAPDASDETADDRVLAWVRDTGCDAWVLPTLAADPLTHAAEWNAHLAHDVGAMDDAIERWTTYFDELGVGLVSEGVVVLRRRDGATPTVRIDPVDDDDLDDAGDQIVRAFETRARLADLDGGAGILDLHLSYVMTLKLLQELEPDDETPAIVDVQVDLGEGTKHAVETTYEALEVIASLDSRLSLREVIDDAADNLELDDGERTRLRRDAVDVARELLELGALQLES